MNKFYVINLMIVTTVTCARGVELLIYNSNNTDGQILIALSLLMGDRILSYYKDIKDD